MDEQILWMWTIYIMRRICKLILPPSNRNQRYVLWKCLRDTCITAGACMVCSRGGKEKTVIPTFKFVFPQDLWGSFGRSPCTGLKKKTGTIMSWPLLAPSCVDHGSQAGERGRKGRQQRLTDLFRVQRRRQNPQIRDAGTLFWSLAWKKKFGKLFLPAMDVRYS